MSQFSSGNVLVETEIVIRRHFAIFYAVACAALAVAFIGVGFAPSHDLPFGVALALAGLYAALALLFTRAVVFPKVIETSAVGITIYHTLTGRSRFIHWEELAVIDLNFSYSVFSLGVKNDSGSTLIQIPFVALKPHAMVAAKQLHIERTAYFTAKIDPEAASMGVPLALEQPEAKFEAPTDFFMSPFVLAVIGLNTLFTLIAIFRGLPWINASSLDLVELGGGYLPLAVRGQAWRLITYGLLHNGLLPLALETLALIIFSRAEKQFDDVQMGLIYVASLLVAITVGAHAHPYGVQVGGVAPLLGLVAASAWRKTAHYRARQRGHLAYIGAFFLLALTIISTFESLDVAPLIGGAIAGLALGYFSVTANAQKLMGAAGGLAALSAGVIFMSPKPVDALGAVEHTQQSLDVIKHYAQAVGRPPQTREECESLDKEITAKQLNPAQEAQTELAPLRAINEEPTQSQVQKLLSAAQNYALQAKVRLASNVRLRRQFVFNEDLRSGRLTPEQGIAQIVDQWLPEIKDAEPLFASALPKNSVSQLQKENARITENYLAQASKLAFNALKRDYRNDVKRATELLEANDPKDPLLEVARQYVISDFQTHLDANRTRLAKLKALGAKQDLVIDQLVTSYADTRFTFNALAVDYSTQRRFKQLSQAWLNRTLDAPTAKARVTEIVAYLENYKLSEARVPASSPPTPLPLTPSFLLAQALATERRAVLLKFADAVKIGKIKNIRAVESDWRNLNNGPNAEKTLAEAKQIILSAGNLRDEF